MIYNELFENKLHTDTFGYNTYICTIPDDFRMVVPHWHSDIEIIVITSGCGVVRVDFEEYRVDSGDIVFIHPGAIHSIEQCGDNRMEYENIFFTTTLLKSHREDVTHKRYFLPLEEHRQVLPVYISTKIPFYTEVISHIKKLDELNEKKDKCYELYIKSELFALFAVLFSNTSTSTHKEKTMVISKIKEIIDYVGGNYQSNVSIGDIATAVGFSQSHFMRFFKEHMNTTFVDYLNDYRLEKAASMLINTDKKILAIALDCGFNNLSYFNRVFMKKYGKTPREHRK